MCLWWAGRVRGGVSLCCRLLHKVSCDTFLRCPSCNLCIYTISVVTDSQFQYEQRYVWLKEASKRQNETQGSGFTLRFLAASGALKKGFICKKGRVLRRHTEAPCTHRNICCISIYVSHITNILCIFYRNHIEKATWFQRLNPKTTLPHLPPAPTMDSFSVGVYVDSDPLRPLFSFPYWTKRNARLLKHTTITHEWKQPVTSHERWNSHDFRMNETETQTTSRSDCEIIV